MVCMGSSAQSAALGLVAASSIDGVLFLAAVAVLGDTVGFSIARRERFVHFSRIRVGRQQVPPSDEAADDKKTASPMWSLARPWCYDRAEGPPISGRHT